MAGVLKITERDGKVNHKDVVFEINGRQATLEQIFEVVGQQKRRIAELERDKTRLDWIESERAEISKKLTQRDGCYVTWTINQTWKEPVTRRSLREAIDYARRERSSEPCEG